MKKVTLALASAAAISSAPAFAQDDSWTGPYVGLGLGVVQSNSDASASVVGKGAGPVFVSKDDATQGEQAVGSFDSGVKSSLGQDKVFGTIEAGYDFQVGKSFVIGAFANFDYMFGGRGKNSTRSNLSSTGAWAVGANFGDLVDPKATGANLAINTSAPCGRLDANDKNAVCTYDYFAGDHGLVDQQAYVRTQDTWALGARAGALVSPKTLLYVSGGYTQTKVRMGLSAEMLPSVQDYAGLTEVARADSTFSVADSEWERDAGFFLGAGVETKLTNNVSLKLDYRYSDYGSRAISGTRAFDFVYGTGKDAVHWDIATVGSLTARDISTHAVRANIAYRF